MRALLLAGIIAVAAIVPATAAVLAPNEIQDGKMTREPIGAGGAKSDGTWKLSKEGFCTTWKGAKANCYRVQSAGEKKWSVMKGTTVVATWEK
jgi:hypothetical protein